MADKKKTTKNEDIKSNKKIKDSETTKKTKKEETKSESKDSKKKAKATKIPLSKEEKAKLKKQKKELKAEKKANNKGKNKKTIKLCATTILIILVLLAICYVTNTIIKKNNFQTKNPVATIVVENYGTIKVELLPEYAPNTVNNFIALANNKFYDGLTFHRTIPDFMIQGGDPNGDGTGNAKLSSIGKDGDDNYSIEGEFVLNGFTQNTLKCKRGVIAMARSDYSQLGTSIAKEGYNSASCQFFIVTSDDKESSLDGQYAGFGQVIEGMDVVDKIANVDVETRDSNPTDNTLTTDRPVDPPVITSITVDTHNVTYDLPVTQKPFDVNSYLMQQYYGGSSSY